jgi:hypothetical protein
LRRPTDSQERIGRRKSACSLRNDMVGVGSTRVVIPVRRGELKRKALRGIIQDLLISHCPYLTALASHGNLNRLE